MSDWMSGVKGSQSCFPNLKAGKPSEDSDLSQPLPSGQLSSGCTVLSPSLYLLPQRTFPQWGRGLGTEELLSPWRAAEQKRGGFRYQRGAGSRADPELALCLGSLILSRVWLLYVSTPGCGPLSGWPCQPSAVWSLEKVQQDLQNGISFCPCSLSLTHTHTSPV